MSAKKTNQLLITLILIFVFLFAISNAIKRVKKSGGLEVMVTSALEDRASKGKDLPSDNLSVGLYGMLEGESKKIGLIRDPFTGDTITSQETATSTIYLSGIFFDQNLPMAIINDNIIKIGDRIDEYTVVGIEQDKVILNDGVKDLELKWKPLK
jgi:hypothetical protein